jgi:hypothetical protein
MRLSDSGIYSLLTASTNTPTTYSAALDSPHHIDALLYSLAIDRQLIL